MRKMVWIRFSEHADRAYELLRPLGFKANESTWIQEVNMPFDDERRRMLTEGLARRGIAYTEMEYQVFEEGELRTADYLHVTGKAMWGYPQPEDGYERESYDVSTACPKCLQGARQVRPFMVKNRPNFGKNDVVTMFWTYDFLFNERIKDLVKDSSLTGAEFWPVFKYRKTGLREEVRGAYQLFITSELPPMAADMKFEMVPLPKGVKPCSCGKLGRNLRGTQARYRSKDLRHAMDFNKTYEWLGGGYGTTQWKVVSHRVYDLFTENKIKGVKFEPVIIEE